MAKNDPAALQPFINKLIRELSGFRRLSERHQRMMAKYIFEEGTYRRMHKLEDDYSTFYHRQLERDFGRGEFNRINRQLDIFEVTRNWYMHKGATKGYRLTLQVARIRASYLKPKTRNLAQVIMENGETMRTLPNPIESKGNGNIANAWRGATASNQIPVDGALLRRLHAHLSLMESQRVSADLFAQSTRKELTACREIIEKLLKWAETDVAGRDCITHRYKPSDAGRLYAKGSVTLQNAPKLIRKAALHGLHDYDFENCHYAIFAQMAEAHGCNYPAIKHYLANKEQVRYGVAEQSGISKDDAKSCLMALMYGANTTEWKHNAIPKKIGGRAAALYENREFAGIAAEVKACRKVIIDAWPKRRANVLNDLGGRIRIDEGPKKVLAHLIQGIEAKALRAAIEANPDDVVLLMHDGFITTRPIDIDAVQALVAERTGYNLSLSYERIKIPPHMDLSG